MKEFDRDEQAIYDAFSQIEVDTNKLRMRVLMNQNRTVKKRAKLSVAIAAMMIFVALSATIYASTGGLEQFLSQFKPNFGEFAIAPLEPAYTEDQGIRIEVVGAQQIGHVVLAYISIQDVSGENRLTQYTMPDLEISVDGQIMNGPSSSRRLEFERSTNTLYFEKLIVGEINMPRSDTLELIATTIYNNERSGKAQRLVEGYWEVQVNTSDLGIQPLIWTDVTMNDVHIDYMSLSPFGLQIVGTHHIDVTDIGNFPIFEVEIEFENRRRNTRLPGGGGGFGLGDFTSFQFADAPIDVEEVAAVIINGERVQIP